MRDQTSLLPEIRFWIAEVDNSCRMWKCPECGGRIVGQPLHWHQFNAYNYCPYCGERLETRQKDLIKQEVMR